MTIAMQVDVKLLKQNNLSRTSILNSLHSRVPMDYATKLSAVQTEAEAPFVPIGTMRQEETLPDGSSLQIFYFTADSPEAVKFVNRMQTFAVWLIETGQGIEVPDPKWNVFTLYHVEKGPGNQPIHTLLGFYTAYRYWVYDKVPPLFHFVSSCYPPTPIMRCFIPCLRADLGMNTSSAVAVPKLVVPVKQVFK